jgi:hypothetical protein
VNTYFKILPRLPLCEQLVEQHLLDPTSRFASSFGTTATSTLCENRRSDTNTCK